jgi:hypothetical protein
VLDVALLAVVLAMLIGVFEVVLVDWVWSE